MSNIEFQFAIAGIINGLVQLTVLIATIIMFAKKRNTATVLLCFGSVLSTIGFVGGYIYNIIAAQNGTEAIIQAQINLNYFNTFAHLIFGIGLLLLAISHYGTRSKVSVS